MLDLSLQSLSSGYRFQAEFGVLSYIFYDLDELRDQLLNVNLFRVGKS